MPRPSAVPCASVRLTAAPARTFGTVPASAITRIAVVDPTKAPELCYCARINAVTIVRHREVGADLRSLTRWIFGDAPPHFDGPPDRERAGIKITDLTRKAA
jgi:hypothetical protein